MSACVRSAVLVRILQYSPYHSVGEAVDHIRRSVGPVLRDRQEVIKGEVGALERVVKRSQSPLEQCGDAVIRRSVEVWG